MKLQEAIRMGLGATGGMTIVGSMVLGSFASVAFLHWWALVTVPLLIFGGYTCGFILVDWATDPQ